MVHALRNRRVVAGLVVGLLTAVPLAGMALEVQPAPRSGTERPTGRELLAQQIRIDQPDLKMDGEIVLKSLSPLTGVVRLRQARGEPRKIFAGVMRLIPGAKQAFDGFFDQLNVHDLDLRDLVITVTPEGYGLQLATATIPEGGLKQVSGQLDFQKRWQLESGSLQLSNIPLHPNSPVPPLPLSYRQLKASGAEGKTFALDVEKIRMGHLAIFRDPTGFFGDVLRAMGFAKGFDSAPILLDRLAVTAVADAKQLATQSLLLLAPNKAKATGQATMAWQPKPRQLHLKLDVTTDRHAVSHFKTVLGVADPAI